MLVPTENIRKIYQFLFQEGVMICRKDFNAPSHPDIDVPNLHVVKVLQSLHSRGYLSVVFSWQYYYYTLTDKGIEFLRNYLHLPLEIVPRTFIKTNKPMIKQPQGERRPFGGERNQEYRAKKDMPAPDFNPNFRGGVGRGRPQPQQQE